MKKLSDYKLLENNPFPAKEEKSIERLAGNIKMLPKMLSLRPIVVDENNVILVGNKRYQALLHLGYTEVKNEWIKTAKDYTREELDQLILLDNVNEGKWDSGILLKEYEGIDIETMGIDIPSYHEVDFIPDYNPEQGDNTVSAGDISKVGDKLNGAMSGEQTRVEIVCPHCTETFEINM